MENWHSRFLKKAQCRRDFVNVWGPIFGVLASVLLLLLMGKHGGVAWWIILVVLAFAAGWVWAFCMWYFVEKQHERE